LWTEPGHGKATDGRGEEENGIDAVKSANRELSLLAAQPAQFFFKLADARLGRPATWQRNQMICGQCS
jgi:hypothetical protein